MGKRTSGRIELPKNPKELLNLAQQIVKKHQTDGAASSLNVLTDIKWEELGPVIDKTLENHLQAEEAKRKAEDLYRERDKHLTEISKIIRSTAALLKALHRENPKKLGEWGFEINDSPIRKTPGDKPIDS